MVKKFSLGGFVAICLLLSLLSVNDAHAAYCLGGFPQFFYGDIQINGADAPVGTEIRALIDGEVKGTYTTISEGVYGSSTGQDKLSATGNSDGYDDVPLVTFEVFYNGNWYETEESHDYQCGAVTQLDLDLEVVGGPVDNDGDSYTDDVDCDDNNDQVYPGSTEICNGIDDNCVDGVDEASLADLDCNDGVSCTQDVCSAGSCQNTVDDSVCDNGLFCDGTEYCDATLDCQDGTAPSTDDGVSCTIDSCDEENDEIVNTRDDSFCDNGLFCDGEEYCHAILDCQPDPVVDCSAHDLPAISECGYDPDGNPFTLDQADGFTSVCDEDADACTTQEYDFTHTCDLVCGAECTEDSDCGSTVCNDNDGCYGTTYRDYHNVDNTCSSCACEVAECTSYTEFLNDDRCIDVQDDDEDGVPNDEDVCEGHDDNVDSDNDGTPDGCDVCPNDAQDDIDSDGYCADVDNCPTDSNPDQLDTDGDNIGDVCDDTNDETYQTQITMYEGWTLFALPFNPVDFDTTEELGLAINETAATCSVVMTYEGSTQTWKDDILGLSDPTFDLESTEGYFIFCDQEVSFEYTGTLW